MGTQEPRAFQDETQYGESRCGVMFGRKLPSTTMAATSPSDPNELLQRIDQQTTQMFHWVRAGTIVIILLLIIVVVIG